MLYHERTARMLVCMLIWLVASCAPASPEGSVESTSPPAPQAAPTTRIIPPVSPSATSALPAATPDRPSALSAERPRFATSEWKTDFSRHSVSYDQIIDGGPPRDGIPPIDKPVFIAPGEAAQWLRDNEPVILFEMNGDARAYPLQIMIWHEIVNDSVGGQPVIITFCPLCNAAIAFDRMLDGVIHDFGTTGKLRNSDLIMWDRQTESWWQQFTGEAIVGMLTGKRLKFLPASVIAFAEFRKTYPNGKVLSRETGYVRDYGRNPYVGYDDINASPFLFNDTSDPRLRPMERVAAATIGDLAIAYPYSVLSRARVVNDNPAGKAIVVFWRGGTTSALDQLSIAGSRDVGATGMFERTVNSQTLTFEADADGFVDVETRSRWNILGQALGGPLRGQRLTPVIHFDHFWFAWAAFKPQTLVYQGAR